MLDSRFLKAAAAVFVIGLVGDYLWHQVLFVDFYNQRLVAITGAELGSGFPPWIFLLEVVGAIGITYFVRGTLPAQVHKKFGEGLWRGAFLGLLMGGAINAVNHSLIPQWDLALAATDTAWAVILTAIGGGVVAWISRMKA